MEFWKLASVYGISAIVFFVAGYGIGMSVVVRSIAGLKYKAYMKGRADGIKWCGEAVAIRGKKKR